LEYGGKGTSAVGSRYTKTGENITEERRQYGNPEEEQRLPLEAVIKGQMKISMKRLCTVMNCSMNGLDTERETL
jgi:hypothetical protein